MSFDEMAQSPWSMVPKTNQAAPTNAPMAPTAAPMSLDSSYPSFPNAAGLGSQIPFDPPPVVVPVPAYHQSMPVQMPMVGEHPEMDAQISPWSLLRGAPNATS